ncbi:MAG: ABC transporter ATP-binding protein [Deltaproteobacteria bacterium]|nr:MAG: ABC transporter ATP-binding protein [Deltaproteobacteria bacterium]
MEEILELKEIRKSFEGFLVIDDVSFTVKKGELSAIIGPNGAGKSTLFNLITGYYKVDKGLILYNGTIINNWETEEIVRNGVGRSFQVSSIFQEETVLDNVKMACLSKATAARNFIRKVELFDEVTEKSLEILGSLGLEQQANRFAYELAHGDQKLLDIGIALALEPALLLLDEPTAGMSPEERFQTTRLIRKLWEQYDLTLIFIEHDMDLVFEIAEWIRVLHQGSLLAEGKPDDIKKNEDVISAYLGDDHIWEA